MFSKKGSRIFGVIMLLVGALLFLGYSAYGIGGIVVGMIFVIIGSVFRALGHEKKFKNDTVCIDCEYEFLIANALKDTLNCRDTLVRRCPHCGSDNLATL